MIRFPYTSPSGRRYFVTAIVMDDGSIDAYAASEPGKHREIPVAVEPSRYPVARAMIQGGIAALARAGDAFTEAETFAPGGPLEKIGANLAEVHIWTAVRTDAHGQPVAMRTDWPQPLSFFLQ